MLTILDSLPRFSSGEYLFSTTFGRSPVWVSDKIKKRLDRRMLRTVRALARKRGNNAAKATVYRERRPGPPRARGCSEPRVNSDVAEAVLGHVKSGVLSSMIVTSFSTRSVAPCCGAPS